MQATMRMSDRLPYEVRFLMHTKAFELSQEGDLKIEAQDLENYLRDVVWKKREEMELCEVVDDVMSTVFSSVFDYMRTKVIIDAKDKSIEDFNDLIFK